MIALSNLICFFSYLTSIGTWLVETVKNRNESVLKTHSILIINRHANVRALDILVFIRFFVLFCFISFFALIEACARNSLLLWLYQIVVSRLLVVLISSNKLFHFVRLLLCVRFTDGSRKPRSSISSTFVWFQQFFFFCCFVFFPFFCV